MEMIAPSPLLEELPDGMLRIPRVGDFQKSPPAQTAVRLPFDPLLNRNNYRRTEKPSRAENGLRRFYLFYVEVSPFERTTPSQIVY